MKRHLQEIKVLNRVIGWGNGCLTYEADPRHAKTIIKELELQTSKAVIILGSRDDAGKSAIVTANGSAKFEGANEDNDAEQQLSGAEATRVRGLVASANYLAQDRVDLHYFIYYHIDFSFVLQHPL